MRIQSMLRLIHPLQGFVYGRAEFHASRSRPSIDVNINPRCGSRPHCSGCGKRRRGYDTGAERRFSFVPLWGIAVFLLYATRRVDCPKCGVVVEMLPWASRKSPMTHAYAWFLASWAKSLSWKETARRFQTTWDAVFRAVGNAVEWGLSHRDLDGVRAIGVDELAWKKGHKYLTLVYQIDHGRRRLLHIAKERTAASFNHPRRAC